jgi:hypothetical protein
MYRASNIALPSLCSAMTKIAEGWSSSAELPSLRVTFVDNSYTALELAALLTDLETVFNNCVGLALELSRPVRYRTANESIHALAALRMWLDEVKKQSLPGSAAPKDEVHFTLEIGEIQIQNSMLSLAIIESEEGALAERFHQLRVVENRTFGLLRHYAALGIEYLKIASPLTIELTPVGLGSVGLGAYALHLLACVLRNPEKVGSWLPRLIQAWHQSHADKAGAQLQRLEAESELRKAVEILSEKSRILANLPSITDLSMNKTVPRLPATYPERLSGDREAASNS